MRRPTTFVVILLAIILALIGCQFLFIPDLYRTEPTYPQLTATSIVATNHMVETLISQTQAAASSTP